MADVPADAARAVVEEALVAPTGAPRVSVFSKAFLRYAGERAAKTLAQVVIALMGAGTVGALDLNPVNAGVTAALAVVASVATSVVAATSSVDTPQ